MKFLAKVFVWFLPVALIFGLLYMASGGNITQIAKICGGMLLIGGIILVWILALHHGYPDAGDGGGL